MTTAHPPVCLWPDPQALGPLTDLYQLAMMAGYHAAGLQSTRAVFEMFVRRLPANRAYLVFAGLEQAVGDLLNLKFSKEQVEYIRRLPLFGLSLMCSTHYSLNSPETMQQAPQSGNSGSILWLKLPHPERRLACIS